jgi:hypothetical protein
MCDLNRYAEIARHSDAGVITVARGGALDNPAPRFARGRGATTDTRPLQDLARREHFVVAAFAATNLFDARFHRAERGAGLSSAPPRATAATSSRISSHALRRPFDDAEVRLRRMSANGWSAAEQMPRRLRSFGALRQPQDDKSGRSTNA